MLSLAVTSDKPSVVNYRYVPGGLWLEDVHTLPEKKVFFTHLCVYANTHLPPCIIFIFALNIRQESTVTECYYYFPCKDPEWPTGSPIRRKYPSLTSTWARLCSCWFKPQWWELGQSLYTPDPMSPSSSLLLMLLPPNPVMLEVA